MKIILFNILQVCEILSARVVCWRFFIFIVKTPHYKESVNNYRNSQGNEDNDIIDSTVLLWLSLVIFFEEIILSNIFLMFCPCYKIIVKELSSAD